MHTSCPGTRDLMNSCLVRALRRRRVSCEPGVGHFARFTLVYHWKALSRVTVARDEKLGERKRTKKSEHRLRHETSESWWRVVSLVRARGTRKLIRKEGRSDLTCGQSNSSWVLKRDRFIDFVSRYQARVGICCSYRLSIAQASMDTQRHKEIKNERERGLRGYTLVSLVTHQLSPPREGHAQHVEVSRVLNHSVTRKLTNCVSLVCCNHLSLSLSLVLSLSLNLFLCVHRMRWG